MIPVDCIFIGYYTSNGPNGFVEGATKALALHNAKKVIKDWPKAKHGEALLKKKTKLWTVTIWTE